MLDDPTYTDQAKVQFIKDALSDTTKDIFNSIEDEPIKFWLKNSEAKQLIENYFSKLQCELSDDAEQERNLRYRGAGACY
ncbi:hypothetical protein FAM09_28855 [Niastella caeni]|uniref:Uncharacterized protein n=1 Tax=Niastella caeni TaxID=2569763 RepID=A0A4V4GZ32_9BACT|nr:hypothetical protein [Niastella caeni]THU31096.1 hypothetical protein FAM09_28855 [Niastella caeni]